MLGLVTFATWPHESAKDSEFGTLAPENLNISTICIPQLVLPSAPPPLSDWSSTLCPFFHSALQAFPQTPFVPQVLTLAELKSHPLSALPGLRAFLRQWHLTVSGAELVRNQQLQSMAIKAGRKGLTLQEPIFPLAQLHMEAILPITLRLTHQWQLPVPQLSAH